MSPAFLLKSVKEKYPELKKLPKTELRLVEEAIVFANRLGSQEEPLSDKEHKQLMKKLSPIGGNSPGNSLKAYRLREDFTQKDLSEKSGIAQANISAMEKGRRAIGLETAKTLAAALNCEYKKLV